MIIKVNGRELEAAKGSTLLSIIEKEGLMPGRIVVEFNKEIISGDRLGDIFVNDKDSIEILSFVGGG